MFLFWLKPSLSFSDCKMPLLLTRASHSLSFWTVNHPFLMRMHLKPHHVCAVLLFLLFIVATRFKWHKCHSNKDGCQVRHIVHQWEEHYRTTEYKFLS